VKTKRFFGVLAAGTVIHAALAAWPLAQAATTDESSGSQKTGDLELQEVTVTARRVSENLQVVPISITVLSGADIQQKNIIDVSDFNQAVPGLAVTPSYLARATAVYTIRGQGQTEGGGDPGVATYFNDVPTPATGPGYLFDLSSVQVLKGPQGTLFGKNSTGGAVLVLPQRPTNFFDGYLDFTAGNYNAKRYQAAINAPIISDVLSARFAVDYNTRNGYTTNPYNGQDYDDIDYQGVRFGLLYTPTDWLENYFLTNFSTLNEHAAGGQLVAFNPNGFLSTFPGAAAAYANQMALGPRQINAWLPPVGQYIRARNYAADNTTTIKLNDGISLKNIFGYREALYLQSYDSFGLPFPYFEIIGTNPKYYSSGYGIPNPSDITYSDEFQVRGDSLGNRLHWTAGLYASTTSPHSGDDKDFADVFGTAMQVVAGIRHDKSQAVYGQFTYDFTDHFKFTAGARYTQDLRDQIASQYIPARAPCEPGVPFPPPTAGLGYCLVNESAKFHSPQWDVSLQYQLNPDTMFYLTSTRGYKSGGFNNTAPSDSFRNFQPEHVTNYELGAKSEFQIGGLKARINADVFRSEFTDWQERVLTRAVTAVGTQTFAVILNVGAGIVEGADFEATLIPFNQLELSAFFNYMNPYYTSNEYQGKNFVSVQVPNITREKASFTARYLLGVPSTVGEASVSATIAYQSIMHQLPDLIVDNPDPRHGILPGYQVLNLGANWKGVLGHNFDLSAFVDNATNRTYLVVMQDGYSTESFDTGQYAPPRMFGVSARWRYK